jgi:hypothetical protein
MKQNQPLVLLLSIGQIVIELLLMLIVAKALLIFLSLWTSEENCTPSIGWNFFCYYGFPSWISSNVAPCRNMLSLFRPTKAPKPLVAWFYFLLFPSYFTIHKTLSNSKQISITNKLLKMCMVGGFIWTFKFNQGLQLINAMYLT